MNIVPIPNPPKRASDWEGMYVKSYRAMNNGYFSFPANTIFKIKYAGRTKSLEALPCECCGISRFITIKGTKDGFMLDFMFVELEG